jgi:hypothetical protein
VMCDKGRDFLKAALLHLRALLKALKPFIICMCSLNDHLTKFGLLYLSSILSVSVRIGRSMCIDYSQLLHSAPKFFFIHP